MAIRKIVFCFCVRSTTNKWATFSCLQSALFSMDTVLPFFPANQAIDPVMKAFVRAQKLAAVDTIIKQVQA